MTLCDRVAAKYKEKKKVKTQKGESTVYLYSERQVKNRNKEKAKRLESLRKNIGDLMGRVKRDLKSEDVDTKLTALAVALVDSTYERIGNEESADERGHYGVTGWLKSHVKFSKSKAVIKYTGKAGVEHTKEVKDKAILSALRDACEAVEKDDPIFEYDGGTVTPEKVNAYLKPSKITAKDLRGYHANDTIKAILRTLRGKGGKLPKDKEERKAKLKEEWKQALAETAEIIGHESITLKKSYLVPGLEADFMKNGTVNDKMASLQSSRYSSIAQRVSQRWAHLHDCVIHAGCPVCGFTVDEATGEVYDPGYPCPVCGVGGAVVLSAEDSLGRQKIASEADSEVTLAARVMVAAYQGSPGIDKTANMAGRVKDLLALWKRAPSVWEKIKEAIGLPDDFDSLSMLGKAHALMGAFKEFAAQGKKAVAHIFHQLPTTFPLSMFFVPRKKVPGITDLLARLVDEVPWLKSALGKASAHLGKLDDLLDKYVPITSKVIKAAAFIWVWFAAAELSWDIPFLVRGFTGLIGLGELFGSMPESALGLIASMFGLGYGALPVTLVIRLVWLVAEDYLSWVPGKGLKVHWDKLGIQRHDELVVTALVTPPRARSL